VEMKPKVGKNFPGPKAKELIKADTRCMATITKDSPIAIKRGMGVYVDDLDGNRFLDFTSGIGVLNVGHTHPAVVKAIKDQSEKFLHFVGGDYYYQPQVDLAERLAKLAPGPSSKRVFFTNSGTESVEAAIKLSLWSTKRKRIIGFIGAFHGRTMGSLSITCSKSVHRNRYFPMVPGVTHVPYAYCYRCPYGMEYPDCGLHCARVIDEVYLDAVSPAEETAAMFVEPMQGEGGYILPPDDFHRELSRICKRHKMLYVADEIQSGCGRTGKMFAIEHTGVAPDVIAMAKGLGSGLPIGAIVFDKKHDWGVKGAHANTFGGNPVCCEAAKAGLEVIEKDRLLKNTVRMGKIMSERLHDIYDRYDIVGDVRGRGLMQAAELVKSRRTKKHAVKERDRIADLCLKNGMIALGCGKSAIRFIPPLIIGEEDLNLGMDIFEGSVKEVAKA